MIIEAQDSKPAITEALTGRTIEYVSREPNGIKLCTTCGHEIELEVENGQIRLKSINVRIALQGLNLFGQQGKI